MQIEQLKNRVKELGMILVDTRFGSPNSVGCVVNYSIYKVHKATFLNWLVGYPKETLVISTKNYKHLIKHVEILEDQLKETV